MVGTTRYVYNKCLNRLKREPKLNNVKGYSQIRKEYITKKGNNIITNTLDEIKYNYSIFDWELETPKDIRFGALRDIKKAFGAVFSNLRNGNIKTFGLKERTKKDETCQSMEIPNSAISIIKLNKKVRGIRI